MFWRSIRRRFKRGYDGSTNDSSLDTEVSTIEEDGAKVLPGVKQQLNAIF